MHSSRSNVLLQKRILSRALPPIARLCSPGKMALLAVLHKAEAAVCVNAKTQARYAITQDREPSGIGSGWTGPGAPFVWRASFGAALPRDGKAVARSGGINKLSRKCGA